MISPSAPFRYAWQSKILILNVCFVNSLGVESKYHCSSTPIVYALILLASTDKSMLSTKSLSLEAPDDDIVYAEELLDEDDE